VERRVENALKELEIYNARLDNELTSRGATLKQRIDSALKDLELATARILRTDQKRTLRGSGIER
jgi:hypothetical protein